MVANSKEWPEKWETTVMTDNNIFGPQSDKELEIYALENLVFSVQVALQRAMNKQGVNGKNLAEKLGMTPARVSQIFSDRGPNLTLRTIAKIQYALGEDFELVLRSDIEALKKSSKKSAEMRAIVNGRMSPWKETISHNSNRKPERSVAA